MTNKTSPTRQCREKCLNGSDFGECECSCGFNCHGRGVCEPELHKYDAKGRTRTFETFPPTDAQLAAMAAL